MAESHPLLANEDFGYDDAFDEGYKELRTSTFHLGDYDSTRSPTGRRVGLVLVQACIAFSCAILLGGVVFLAKCRATSVADLIVTPARQSISLNGSSKPDKVVVLASSPTQDVSWTADVPDEYITNGREPIAYLRFIIENYFDLPDYTIFLHDHNEAWQHTEPAAGKIRALNLTALDMQGYINFRCAQQSGCAQETQLGQAPERMDLPGFRNMANDMTPRFWDQMFEPYGFGAYPAELVRQRGAEFAVTKSAIQTRSVDFYRNYLKPLLLSHEGGKETFGEMWTGYSDGALYESMWHVVFGKPPVHCPSSARCRSEFFSDARKCDRHLGEFENSQGWEDVECHSSSDAAVQTRVRP